MFPPFDAARLTSVDFSDFHSLISLDLKSYWRRRSSVGRVPTCKQNSFCVGVVW